MKQEALFSKEFIIINAASVLAHTNMAVFFQLHQYLLTLPVDPRFAGFLIGVFSLAGVFMQPLLSPFVNPKNARRAIVIGISATITALILYRWAESFPALLLLRAFHGAAFVTFVTGMNAIMVAFIPSTKSGQAFGVISVSLLLPQAVVPALLGWMGLGPAHFVDVLSVTALLMVPTALVTLFVMKKRRPEKPGTHYVKTGAWQEIKEDLRDARIVALLCTNFLNFLAYTPVFFFIKEYAEGKGIANAGSFFSVATGAMIVIRLVAGALFDRVEKGRMLVVSLLLLSVGYALLIFAKPGLFLILAFILGMGWSLFIPFLNALLFDCSRPSARALNLNLSMAVLQSAYFVGPIIGGLVLHHAGYDAVFLYCGSMTFVGACLSFAFLKSYRRGRLSSEVHE